MDIKSKRMTLVQKENFIVDLEYNEDYAIVHLPKVDKFTKDIYLDMSTVFEDMKEFLKVVGYDHVWAALDPSNKMMIKFAGKMGLSFQGEAENMNVYRGDL